MINKEKWRHVWTTMRHWLKRGAKVYITLMLTMVTLIGTYGLYLWQTHPMEKAQLGTEQWAIVEPTVAQEWPEGLAVQERAATPPAVPVAKADPAVGADTLEVPPVAAPVVAPTPLPEMVNPATIAALDQPCTGSVSRRFGISFDPSYGDYRYHDGIDYALEEDTTIKAATDGTVSAINQLADGYYTVIIAHKSYCTVYQNLTATLVTTGQQVVQGEALGKIETPAGQLHFAVEMTKPSPTNR